MIKAKLSFTIALDYQQTLYLPLIELATSYKWDKELKKGIWVFDYDKLKAVETILTKKVEIEGFRERFDKEATEVPKWKGKDMIEVIEWPLMYQLIEHRKREDKGGVERIITFKNEISKEIVDKVWFDVIAHQPLNKPIKTRTVAENICKALGVVRFNRETGSFSFEKFFGDRHSYMTIFYFPIKILVWKGKVIHYKDGTVERVL